MSSLNKVRMEDGVELSISEWVHQPLFTTIEFGSSASVDFFGFGYTKGERVSGSATTSNGARNASETDTNVTRRRKLNQDEAFVVHSITYEAWGMTSADGGSPSSPVAPAASGNNDAGPVASTNLARLHRDCMFNLFVGAHIEKPQIEVPFEYLAQSIGAYSYASGDLDQIDIGTAGCISADNQKMLKLPLYIGGFGEHAKVGNSQHFHIEFFNARGGAIAGLTQDIRLRFYLDGLYKRPA